MSGVGGVGGSGNNFYIEEDNNAVPGARTTNSGDQIPGAESGIPGLDDGNTPPKLDPNKDYTLDDLSKYVQNAIDDGVFYAVPTMGASMLAMIAEFSAEQRRMNSEVRAAETTAIVSDIREQASELRAKAVTQLVMGVVSGAMSIAQGVGSMKIMNSGVSQNAKSAAADPTFNKNTADMLLNTKTQAFNSSMGGVNQALGGISQSVSSFIDANIKELDANIEGHRAMIDALKSLEDAFKELIQKALSSQDSMQQNSNQTRSKILG